MGLCPPTHTVNLTAGRLYLLADFCLKDAPGEIGDLVWCDKDDDGIRDPGEPGIAGVTVNLTCAGPDGTFGTPMMARRVNEAGTAIRVFWDVTSCSGADYNLLWGQLDDVAAYSLDGAECDLGINGVTNWSGVPPFDLYFLIVSDDAAYISGATLSVDGGVVL